MQLCRSLSIVCGALIGIGGLSPVAAAQGNEKPEAMRRAELARSKDVLRSSHLEIKVKESDSASTFFSTWRAAGPDYIANFRGDEEGVAIRDWQTGGPGRFGGHDPRKLLVRDERTWRHVGLQMLVKSAPLARTPLMVEQHDPRLLGLSPSRAGDMAEDISLRARASIRWSADTDGALDRVKASIGDESITWWIDPARGDNPVRIEIESPGAPGPAITEIELSRFGEVWFPKRIVKRTATSDAPETIIDVLYAHFNEPSDPERFTLADIDVEVGANVEYEDDDGVTRNMMWNGTEPVTLDEFHQQKDAGLIRVGPTIVREGARELVLQKKKELEEQHRARTELLGGPVDKPGSFMADWEQYTLAFIATHALDEKQRGGALRILGECINAGRAALARRDEDVAEFDRLTAEIDAAAPGDRAKRAALDERRQQLVAPLTKIFETRLKPRLESLLTAEQRAKAAKSAPAAATPVRSQNTGG